MKCLFIMILRYLIVNFFYFNLLIIGILKEIFYLYFLKFNYVYICIYVVLVVYIFVCYMIKFILV